jgi:beta-lactamase superfamily II metal-dependent hydrolase
MRYTRSLGLALGVSLLSVSITFSLHAQQPAPAVVGAVLPPWSAGMLDIHQIATGRGNSAFTIFPDGTTMLFDAGDGGDTAYAEPKPDASRTPGQWIARYVTHMLQGRPAEIDYAVLSHLHPDHIGRISGPEKTSAFGDYKLAGSPRSPRRCRSSASSIAAIPPTATSRRQMTRCLRTTRSFLRRRSRHRER